MNETLSLIVSIGKLDVRIDTIRGELKNIPLEIQRGQKELDSLIIERTSLEQRLESQKRKRFQEERTLEELQIRLEKYQKQLFDVKTNEEYSAILREIDHTKNEISVLEDEVIMLLEEYDNLEVELKKKGEEVNYCREELDRLISNSMNREKELKSLLEMLENERVEISMKIDKIILSRYEKTRQHNLGTAIALIESGVCQECHVLLPPQLISRVIVGETIERCPNCARFLYVENL
ncbi:MAG: zinc ribbon domain-containing protein [bacterium]